MADTGPEASEVMSSMMEWGLYDLVGAEERRCMQLVCRDLQQAVSDFIETIAVRLDSAVCKDPATAAAMAAFHCRCHSANELHVHLSYSATVGETAASSFMEAYAQHCRTGANRMLTAKHCLVSIAVECLVQAGPITALISCLPALEALAMRCDVAAPCSSADTPAAILAALAGCTHLHALALVMGCVHHEAPFKPSEALSQLTQLRVLSLDWSLSCSDLAPLSRLPDQECLCSSRIHSADAGVRLPRVHTVRAAWDTPPCAHWAHKEGWPNQPSSCLSQCTCHLDKLAARGQCHSHVQVPTFSSWQRCPLPCSRW